MILSKRTFGRAGSESTPRRSRAALPLSVALLLLTVSPLPAEQELPGDELPEDTREFWRVEVLGVQTNLADRELLGVATGIPQLLIDALEPVETHQLSRNERLALARGRLEELRLENVEELHELSRELELLPFEAEGDLAREERAVELAGQIDEAEALLRRIEATDPGRVEVAREKAVELLSQEAPEFSRVFDLEGRAEESEADLVIYGELERSDEYLFLTLYEYNYHLRRERLLGSTASLAEEFPTNLDELIQATRTLVAGRPVASLTVDLTGFEPGRGEVIVDGVSQGFGSLTVPILPLGAREVRVIHPAIEPIERTVLVGLSGENRIEITIPSPRTGYVSLVTDPPGADIYVDSRWQGVTPFLLERPPEQRQVRLSLEDYYDSQLLLSPASPTLLRRELLPRQIVWEDVVEEKRERFYRSFGWFVLSLPAPIILNGVYGNLTTLFPDGSTRTGLSTQEAEERLDQANTLFYSYYATLGVSVALFGNMLFRLIDYIRTGEGYHDR
ncbi:MAG: PEGA domain-containing protein [Alkalispirochaetaceae bacterium]